MGPSNGAFRTSPLAPMADSAFVSRGSPARVGLSQLQPGVSGMDRYRGAHFGFARRRLRRSGVARAAFRRRVLCLRHALDLYGDAPIRAVASVGSGRCDGADDFGGLAVFRCVYAMRHLDRAPR